MTRLEKIIGVEIITAAGDEIRVGHSFYEVEVLKDFILQENPDHFIEIGLHEGGLSYLLLQVLRCHYVGVEINCNEIRPAVEKMYAERSLSSTMLMCLDCFRPEVYDYVYSMHPKIIYCDGGNKAKEIVHFKFACWPGDIIMCHDFWDGTRKVKGIPDDYISKEVRAKDIQVFESDKSFQRLPEEIFGETRIIGWRKL